MKFNINLEKGEYLDAIKRTPSNQIFLFDNLISEKHCDQIVKELQDSDLLYEPDHNIGTHVKCHFLPPSDTDRTSRPPFRTLNYQLGSKLVM